MNEAHPPPDWLEITGIVARDAVERAEQQLLELGALSITLADAANAPVLEPAPGETPLWPRLRVTGLFPAEADPLALLAALQSEMPAAGWRPSLLPGRTWEREWLRDFRPLRFGRRLAVVPTGMAAPAGTVVVRLDPGLAFGTGTHPTTALCLEWLDGLAGPAAGADAPLAGALVLDYGCGSGILGIAALRLGAARVVAVDIDPQAITATRGNAAANGVGDRLLSCLPEELEAVLDGGKADILLANILAGPLHALLPRFAALLKPGARFALSGVLAAQGPALAAAAAAWFRLDPPAGREEWVRISGHARPTD